MANAGIAPPPATMLGMDSAVFDRVIDVNLGGVIKTIRACLPQIVQRRGQLVLVASIYAFTNGALQSPYAAAKAGVEQLGRALRVELAPHGASASGASRHSLNRQIRRSVRCQRISARAARKNPMNSRYLATCQDCGVEA